MTNSPILSVEDLRVRFATDEGQVQAVDGVSFTLREREKLVLVGESGSGKSVTSLSLLRLLPPSAQSSGRIRYRDRELLALPEREMETIRGNQISMIFQDPLTSLNPYLTVFQQMEEVLKPHRGMDRRQARVEAHQWLTKVGIPDTHRRLDHYPHQLSGGMRQRVMIAMALSCHPDILIADEPTTALDVTIQAQILDLIRALSDELGTSVILITHDLGVVAGLCDTVAVMYAGKVVEYGPVDCLFERPLHPYTRGLLRSVPRYDRSGQELHSIPGSPPSGMVRLPGCPFAPRCPLVLARCHSEEPSLVRVGISEARC